MTDCKELLKEWQKIVAYKEQDNYDVHTTVGNLEIIGKISGHKLIGKIIVHPENTIYIIDGLYPMTVEIEE